MWSFVNKTNRVRLLVLDRGFDGNISSMKREKKKEKKLYFVLVFVLGSCIIIQNSFNTCFNDPTLH